MSKRTEQDVVVINDLDTVVYLCYNSIPIIKTTLEHGFVAFHFDAEAARVKQEELSSGKAKVDPLRWSSNVRRIRADFLSPAAKAALQARSERDRG